MVRSRLDGGMLLKLRRPKNEITHNIEAWPSVKEQG
jgi:hypothetical protein